jgi:hypothetical protein
MYNPNLRKRDGVISANTYISYCLYVCDWSIRDIADIRCIAEETVINHLIPYIYHSYLKPRNLDYYDLISNYLDKNQNCSLLKPIFEALEGKVSYNDIKIGYYYYFRVNRTEEEIQSFKDYLCNKYGNPSDIKNKILYQKDKKIKESQTQDYDDYPSDDYSDPLEDSGYRDFERWHKPLRY